MNECFQNIRKHTIKYSSSVVAKGDKDDDDGVEDDDA